MHGAIPSSSRQMAVGVYVYSEEISANWLKFNAARLKLRTSTRNLNPAPSSSHFLMQCGRFLTISSPRKHNQHILLHRQCWRREFACNDGKTPPDLLSLRPVARDHPRLIICVTLTPLCKCWCSVVKLLIQLHAYIGICSSWLWFKTTSGFNLRHNFLERCAEIRAKEDDF